MDGPQKYLMLIEEGENFHYIAVTDLNKILNTRCRTTGLRIQSVWCNICLHGFRNDDNLISHKATCSRNVDPTTLYKMPNRKFCRFQDWSKIVKKPYVIYADFESKMVQESENKTRHEPLAAAGVLIHEGEKVEYASFDGTGCIVEFLKWVDRMSSEIVYPWYDNHGKQPMLPLTRDQEMMFKLSKHCYLCHGVSSKLNRDHDHFTGQYLGPACCKCNLSRLVRPLLQIVFHNLKGYAPSFEIRVFFIP